MLSDEPCPICGAGAPAHDVVDFGRCCEPARSLYPPLTGEAIYYHLCPGCGFCFAPAMHRWSRETFAAKVYNDEYKLVDPDYVETRPRGNADLLARMFPDFGARRHLDFGGGNGLLSRCLAARGWNSASYDPFVDGVIDPNSQARFDLISAFEVLEHATDVRATMREMTGRLAADGLLLVSTLLSDGHLARRERLTWWYAAPRNGHVSLLSRQSLALLAQDFGLAASSASEDLHAFAPRPPPSWARHLFEPA